MHPARAYAWLAFLTGTGMAFTVASYVPYLQQLGLTLADVALLNAFFWMMIVVAELPTGMLADGRSRAWSIRAGLVIEIIGMGWYALAQGFWSALASELAIGIGMAFLSGAQQAWLAEALAKRDELGKLGHAFGTAALTRALGMIIGGAGGAVVGVVSYRLVWLVGVLFIVASLVLAMKTLNHDGEPVHRVSELEAFRRSLSALGRSRALLWAVLAAAAFGLVLPFNHYWAPFFKERVGQVGLAGVWVPMYASLAVAGFVIRCQNVRAGREAGGIIIAILLTGFGLAAIGWPNATLPALGFVLIHELGRGMFDPLLDAFTQHRVESEYRATFGSLHSLLGKLGYGAVLLGVWWGTRGLPGTNATIVRIWEIAGGLLVVAAIILWMFRPHPPPKN